jgi:magnesium transporter
MEVSCLRIDESLILIPTPQEEIPEASRNPDAKFWVDLRNPSEADVEGWLDTLGVQGLARRLCLYARERPGFYPLNSKIFFVIPVLGQAATLGEVEYLAFLCTGNLLLTVHQAVLLDPQHQATIESTEEWLPEASVSGLVSALVMGQSLDDLSRTTALRESVLALEDRMDRDPDSIEIAEILDVRAKVVALGALVTDQFPALQALTDVERPFFQLGGAREYFSCALTNVKAVTGSLSWLDQRVSALRSGFEMHAQDKTNRRLGMLTILSAVFMPISLLAGVWGMNFTSMPELALPYSYPVALGVMVLLGAGMYRFFRRTGWFD